MYLSGGKDGTALRLGAGAGAGSWFPGQSPMESHVSVSLAG